MDIGLELQQARRARAMSIDDVSNVTKISPTLLRAIESDAFDRIPRGLFARGYLRAYARVVGIDPEGVVSQYRELFESPPAETEERGQRVADPDEPLTESRHTELLQMAVIAVVAVAYLASQRPSRSETQRAATPVASASVAAVADASPVGTTGSVATRPMAVEIRAQGPCWVEATVDGDRVIERVLNAGDHQMLAVRDGLALRVGDPATFAFSIDGVPGRTLGRIGVPVRVDIDRSNYTTFLAAR
jgi:cytoskeleton protein RodZ